MVLEYVENGRRVRQMREVTIVNGLSAQNDRRALFGLGSYAGPLTVSIAWCGGAPTSAGPFHRLLSAEFLSRQSAPAPPPAGFGLSQLPSCYT